MGIASTAVNASGKSQLFSMSKSKMQFHITLLFFDHKKVYMPVISERGVVTKDCIIISAKVTIWGAPNRLPGFTATLGPRRSRINALVICNHSPPPTARGIAGTLTFGPANPC